MVVKNKKYIWMTVSTWITLREKKRLFCKKSMEGISINENHYIDKCVYVCKLLLHVF